MTDERKYRGLSQWFILEHAGGGFAYGAANGTGLGGIPCLGPGEWEGVTIRLVSESEALAANDLHRADPK